MKHHKTALILVQIGSSPIIITNLIITMVLGTVECFFALD